MEKLSQVKLGIKFSESDELELISSISSIIANLLYLDNLNETSDLLVSLPQLQGARLLEVLTLNIGA